jgi:outer membrane receptor protein involved in Fe transport
MIAGICARCFALAVALAEAPDAVPAAPQDENGAARVVESIDVVAAADDDAVERARGVALERARLERLPARTLAEAMDELPGVVVLFAPPFGGVPMVIARGFFGGGEVDYVGLEVDGAPRAELESGVADWGAVPLAGVERIDQLPGASLRRGGVDPALAGLVRVTSAAAASEPFSAELSAASFGSSAATFAFRDRDTRAGSIAVDWSETGGYREHSAAEGYGVELGLERPASAGEWSLRGFARHRDREEPGPLSERELAIDPLSSNELFADDRERVDRWGAAARFERSSGRLPFTARLDIDGRKSNFLRTLLLAEGYGDSALRDLETSSQAIGLATPGEIAEGGQFAFRAALDARNERIETSYTDPRSGALRAAERARRLRGAAEVGLAWRPAPDLELDASLRADRIDDRADSVARLERKEALSPRLGLVWTRERPGQALELFAEAGRAFKAPTLDQLYDPRPFASPDGAFTLSNPGLKPQESRGFELGAKFATAALDSRLVAYRQILENEIDFDPATFRYANLGRSRHEGFELSAEARARRIGALRASWARMSARAEGRSPTGQLKNLPRDVVRLGWGAVLPLAIEVDLSYSLLFGRFADDHGAHPLDDVRRVDLRVARRFAALRVAVDALNLFDGDALELAYLLPGAGGGETLHGFAPAPRAFRVALLRTW